MITKGVDTQLMKYGINSYTAESIGLLNSPAEIEGDTRTSGDRRYKCGNRAFSPLAIPGAFLSVV